MAEDDQNQQGQDPQGQGPWQGPWQGANQRDMRRLMKNRMPGLPQMAPSLGQMVGAGFGNGNWGYMPSQPDPYSQGMASAAAANRYGSAMGLAGQLARLPYDLASATVPAQYGAQASMYGANRMGRAQELSSYYPAAAQVGTAHFQPWAYTQAARMNALAQQNMAQIDAQRSRANLADILRSVVPLFGQAQQQPATGGFQTDYGAGFQWR